MSRIFVGVFVGGRAVRLGGVPKGLLLPAPDSGEPIVARLARISREAIPNSEFVLVGDARAYAHFGHHSIDDAPSGIGPIGALIALLDRARIEQADAIALAADMPFVSRELVSRLATHAPGAAAVAPRIDGLWQPLFARYRSDVVWEAATRVVSSGRRALHHVLSYMGAASVELPLSEKEALELRDWDTPADVTGG
jgi:molybdopterin-guanine dinucleotide biosynthesis protein A